MRNYEIVTLKRLFLVESLNLWVSDSSIKFLLFLKNMQLKYDAINQFFNNLVKTILHFYMRYQVRYQVIIVKHFYRLSCMPANHIFKFSMVIAEENFN